MIVIIAPHIIKQTVQNYCIQSELLLTKSLAEILSEHARGTSVFHEVLNWQNSTTSSLRQIPSRWNHKCTVLYWAPLVQNNWVEYYHHFLRNNVSHNNHLFLQGRKSFLKKSTERKMPEPLLISFHLFLSSLWKSGEAVTVAFV